MSKAIFVTGTDTDIGKTYVTGLLLKKLIDEKKDAMYYKAALSGAICEKGRLVPGDAKFVCEMAGIDADPCSLVSYIYEQAVSPHLACRFEGNPVEIKKIEEDFTKLVQQHNYVIVEGSGGILCPVVYDQEKIMLEDIITHLGLSVVIVADAGLGTINHTVLTTNYLQSKNIDIRGIIVNHYEENNQLHNDNILMIEELSGIPVIAKVRKNDQQLAISSENLSLIFKELQ